MKIIIDNELKSLIPALSEEEYAGLEESIVNEGCRDAIVLWGDTLIDGHNRYEICQKHGIPFKTVQRCFKSRSDVIEWMILNQFSRRNLPKYERSRLALRLKPVIAEKAKERMLNPMQNSAQGTARDELASIAGVSHDTIAKVEKLEAEASEETKQKLRSGEISINQAYNAIKSDAPHVAFNSGNNEWYTPSELIEAARAAMGSIDTDPASNELANEVVKAKTFYTVETNGLDKTWCGNVWLNPPYSGDLVGRFIDKLVAEKINYNQAIILVNNATETEWFRKITSISSAVCFPHGRIKFYNPKGGTNSPLQGQALLYVGANKEAFIDCFKQIGWCALIW